MEYVICFRCWETVEKKSNRQKFCHECAEIVNRISERNRLRRKRSLGTSDFYGKRKKDFGAEWSAIQREKRKLGLFSNSNLYII